MVKQFRRVALYYLDRNRGYLMNIKKRFSGSYYVAENDTIRIIKRQDGFWYVDVEDYSDLCDRSKTKSAAVDHAAYVLEMVGAKK